jgi:hypothetical protein
MCGIVEVLDQVASVPPSSTNVLFVDYDAEDWFIAHESIAEIRKKREKMLGEMTANCQLDCGLVMGNLEGDDACTNTSATAR